MTTLYVARHAETEWNRTRTIQGFNDPPLSPTGRRQIAALAAHLRAAPLAAVFSSPSGRALSTAQAVVAGMDRSLPIRALPALAEMHLGPWQGLTFEQVREAWPDEHDLFWTAPEAFVPPPGCESFSALRGRVESAINGIVNEHRADAVLVVTHSLVLKAIWLVVADRALSDFWLTSEFAPASISRFEIDDGGGRVDLLNSSEHLVAVHV